MSVSEVQRARLLNSAVRVVAEQGYEGLTVERVTVGARVSRRTFYEAFRDREDCFLAIFQDALARVTGRVRGAYEQGRGSWRERVRSALGELLVFFDREPVVASLLVVDALAAGPRVLQRRAWALDPVAMVLQQDGSRAAGARTVPSLTGEGVTAAVFGLVHSRIVQKRSGSMLELLNPLMAMIVLPYLGRGAAQRELERGDGQRAGSGRSARNGATLGDTGSGAVAGADPLAGLPMRLTYRTLRVLVALAEQPGVSNRAVGAAAGVHDQGQMSRLLARLARLGLIHNVAPDHDRHQPTGEPNQWRLTPCGEQVERALTVTGKEGK